MDMPLRPPVPNQTGNAVFRPWFRHYQTGEIIWAEDYGLKAFPFRRRKKKK